MPLECVLTNVCIFVRENTIKRNLEGDEEHKVVHQGSSH